MRTTCTVINYILVFTIASVHFPTSVLHSSIAIILKVRHREIKMQRGEVVLACVHSLHSIDNVRSYHSEVNLKRLCLKMEPLLLSVCCCQIITTQVMSIISAVTTLYNIMGFASELASMNKYDSNWTEKCVESPDGAISCKDQITEELDPDYGPRVRKDITSLQAVCMSPITT